MLVVIHPVANLKSFKPAYYAVLKDFFRFFAPEKKIKSVIIQSEEGFCRIYLSF